MNRLLNLAFSLIVVLVAITSQSATANNTVTATVNKTWVEHNVVQNGMKGMRIHADFNVYNAKGKEGYAYVFITDSEGDFVKGKGSASCTKQGSVYVYQKLTPYYDNTIYNDLQLFFPLEHISMKPGEHNYNCIVYISFNDEYIANGENLSFVGTGSNVNNYVPHAPTGGLLIDQTWVDPSLTGPIINSSGGSTGGTIDNYQYRNPGIKTKCPICNGTGRCDRCGGDGNRIIDLGIRGNRINECGSCRGSGRCHQCHGRGYIR